VSKFQRERINPLEVIKFLGIKNDVSHISYNPEVHFNNCQYFRIQQSSHDGTFMFSDELLLDLLEGLVLKSSYYIPSLVATWDNVLGIHYEVGDIRRSVVFGNVELPCGNYPGQKERVRIPVNCKIFFKENV
jgi:hypothetical protein